MYPDSFKIWILAMMPIPGSAQTIPLVTCTAHPLSGIRSGAAFSMLDYEQIQESAPSAADILCNVPGIIAQAPDWECSGGSSSFPKYRKREPFDNGQDSFSGLGFPIWSLGTRETYRYADLPGFKNLEGLTHGIVYNAGAWERLAAAALRLSTLLS